jgi:phenylacetic acid degradation operon negative regulatory protein
MRSEGFTPSTTALAALGGQRVWSLMVSLFGDLAQGSGDAIDGPVLSTIMTALDVRPEATRVALHRLRNDGWLQSRKSGRISQHSLTPKGRQESAAASPRIYAAVPNLNEAWQLVLTEDASTETDSGLKAAGFTGLLPRTYVGPATAIAPTNSLSLHGGTPPDWLRNAVEPGGLAEDYAALLHALTTLRADLPGPDDLSPLDIAVLRCLIVHNWRRLVLKHAALPGGLIRADWPGYQCHVLVDDMLAHYPRPALHDVSAAQSG